MQFDISSGQSLPHNPSNSKAEFGDSVGVLREILDVQKQILSQLKTQSSSQDAAARWCSLLERWSLEYPNLPQACQRAMPILEHAYGGIVADLVDELGQNGDDALDNDFSLQEFLDRYGMRLGQLGNILNLVAPLAEASTRNGSS